jgi:hypothetical protein
LRADCFSNGNFGKADRDLPIPKRIVSGFLNVVQIARSYMHRSHPIQPVPVSLGGGHFQMLQ